MLTEFVVDQSTESILSTFLFNLSISSSNNLFVALMKNPTAVVNEIEPNIT